MLRIRLIAALRVALLGAIAVAWPISAQQRDPAGSLGEVPLPGGLRGALQAIGDPIAPDRSQFLLEFIRRTYSGRSAAPKEAGGGLPALVAYLERSTADGAPTQGTPATVHPSTPSPRTSGICLARHRPRRPSRTARLVEQHPAVAKCRAAVLRRAVPGRRDEVVACRAARVGGELRRGMSARSSPPPRRYASAAARCACPAERPPKDRGKRWPALASASRRHSSVRSSRAMTAVSRFSSARSHRSPSARLHSRCGWMRHTPGTVSRPRSGCTWCSRAWSLARTGEPDVLATGGRPRAARERSAPRREWRADAAGHTGVLEAGVCRHGSTRERSSMPAFSMADRCSSGGCAIRCSAPMPISRLGGTAPCCLRRGSVSRLTPANVRDSVDAIRAAWTIPALSTVLERGRVHDPAVVRPSGTSGRATLVHRQ